MNVLDRFSKNKKSNEKYDENPHSGIRVIACGQTDKQTDGHDEANSHFPQLCDRA